MSVDSRSLPSTPAQTNAAPSPSPAASPAVTPAEGTPAPGTPAAAGTPAASSKASGTPSAQQNINDARAAKDSNDAKNEFGLHPIKERKKEKLTRFRDGACARKEGINKLSKLMEEADKQAKKAKGCQIYTHQFKSSGCPTNDRSIQKYFKRVG